MIVLSSVLFPVFIFPTRTNWNPSLRMPRFPPDFFLFFWCFSWSFFSRVRSSASIFSLDLCLGQCLIISSSQYMRSSVATEDKYCFSDLRYSGPWLVLLIVWCVWGE